MTHICYLCNPQNETRVFDGVTARFSARFVGPPERAHGGMAVAALMCPAMRAREASGAGSGFVKKVSGRLHLPVPLKKDLDAQVALGAPTEVQICDGDVTVVSGQVEFSDSALDVGDSIQAVPPKLAEVVRDISDLADTSLEGPTLQEQKTRILNDAGYEDSNICFGCSEKSHALKLRNRATPNGDLWTRWDVDAEFADKADQLASAAVVAALDCSNLWVMMAREEGLGLSLQRDDGKMWITGSHTVTFLKVPPIDGDYRIVTRFLRQDGRKAFTVAVLMNEEGDPFAIAEDIVILIPLPSEMRLE